MTVAEMTDLRTKLREVGGTFKVVRNRLAKIALKGQPGENAASMFTGPVGIAFSEDFVAAPKVAVDYAKDHDSFEILVLGGSVAAVRRAIELEPNNATYRQMYDQIQKRR